MQPWYYRASMPKVNLNGTLTSPFFYADSDSASGAGQIDVLLMLYGSNFMHIKSAHAGLQPSMLILITIR